MENFVVHLVSIDLSVNMRMIDITKNLLCQYITYEEWKKNSFSESIHHFTSSYCKCIGKKNKKCVI